MVVLDDESPTLLQGETLELLKLEGATSRVWDYFGFPANTHMDRLEETSPMIYTASILTDWLKPVLHNCRPTRQLH